MFPLFLLHPNTKFGVTDAMQRVLWPAGLLCVPCLAINTRLIQDIPHGIPNSTHGYYFSPETGTIRFVLGHKTSRVENK
jgi:hypothetical protein